MRPLVGILVTAMLMQALALAQPASSRDPGPVPSAAQPAVSGKGGWSYAHRGMEALRLHMVEREADGDLPAGEAEDLALPDQNLAGRCLSAERPPLTEPAVVCEYGPTGDQPVAQAILWQEEGVWLGQLYPQAPDRLAAERLEFFRRQGCPVGCHGALRKARLGAGSMELLVIADLGRPGAPMEEVHLLHLVDGEWRVVWTPAPGDWNWGHARVTLQSGLNAFRVRSSSWTRQDRFAGYLAEPSDGPHRWFHEHWVRIDGGYVLKDQVEEPGPYAALVRLVYYLSHRYDRRAQELLGPEVGLDEARKALSQQPPRQGWKVHQVRETAFQLDRDGDGKVDLEVDLRPEGGGWVLSGLQPAASSPSTSKGESEEEAEGEREEAGGEE